MSDREIIDIDAAGESTLIYSPQLGGSSYPLFAVAVAPDFRIKDVWFE